MALLKLGGAVVLLLFLTPLFTEAQLQDQDALGYYVHELDALQMIWADWSESTPNRDSNLAGWSSTQKYPCSGDFFLYSSSSNKSEYIYRPNWRGILCVNKKFNDTYQTFVIGLSLHNASIVGTLPPEIGNFSSLTTLELTGNRKLTGPLPELMSPSLRTLDLHDNEFYGSLPNLPATILNADLSGNKFVGEFRLQVNKHLQTLNLARNQFNDSNLTNAFINRTQLVSLDLSTNKLTGPLPNLTTCRNLQSLVLSNNGFTGSLPDLKMFPYLSTLKLANNSLKGNFPLSSYINTSASSTLSVLDLSGNQLTASADGWNGSDLTFLEELYLDNTGISGTLDITQLMAAGLVRSQLVNGSGGLRTMSIMNNNIKHVIYSHGSIENITTLISLQGNPYCRKIKHPDDGTRCFCEQDCRNQGSRSNNLKVILIATGASTLSVLFIIGVVVSALVYKARRYKRYLLLQVQQKFEEFDVKPTIFSFNELRAATRDFHPDMKLGEGGYGAVYKGVFPNKSMVAVKQLFVKNTHGGEHKTPLSWVVRLNICLGVARGLHYLHSLAHPRIIHRDIKASNILLDKNFEPKIADFGLALLFPNEKSHIMTHNVAGTQGYMAPEYASRGQLSDKVDVFSFGILCLEVLSGQQNIDKTRPLEEVYLSQWAWILHGEGRLMELVDPTLILQDDEKLEMQHLINIALLCSQQEAERRPTMARVVAMLQNDMQSEVVVPMSSNSRTSNSEDFDSTRLLASGSNNSELTPVREELEGRSSALSFNVESSTRSSGWGGGVLQLSEMRAR